MPKRCGDAICGNLIKKGVEPVRVGDKYFCDDECATSWLQQAERFEIAADPFHTPMVRRTAGRMNGG